jgi:hypothetical protein
MALRSALSETFTGGLRFSFARAALSKAFTGGLSFTRHSD